MDDATFRTHERLKAFPPAQLIYIIICRLSESGAGPVVLWLYDKIVRRAKGYSVPRVSRVAPNLYVGGQHHSRGLAAMRDLGITAVVNMREESDDRARGVALDDYLWVETTDDTPPTLEELETGADFIAEQITTGSGVYIHCAAGVGRAPTMAAAYLIREGATASQAWDTIRATRPFIRPTPPQVRIIDAFERRYLRHDGEAAAEAGRDTP